MRALKDGRGGERGQVMVIAALMMTVALGFLGLVIDVGNAYAQRRLMQNASDAASVAAARHLATRMQSGTSDAAMIGVLNTYLAANGDATFALGAPIGADEGAWYVGPSGARVASVGSGFAVPAVPPGGAPTVTGVEVVASRSVDTFFARVLGVETIAVAADSTARYGGQASQELQPPGGTNVLPIAVDLRTYTQSVATCGGFNGYHITFTRDIDDPFTCSGNTGDGGFNWSPLNVTGSNSNSVIDRLLRPTSDLAANGLRIGDSIEIAPGERATDYRELDDTWQGQDVIVPLVGDTTGTSCPNCWVPVVEFAWLHIYRANEHGSVKYIEGWWVDPRGKPPFAGRQLGSSSTITGPVTFALTR